MNIRKTRFAIVLLCGIVQMVWSQTEEEIIQDIRNKYAEITAAVGQRQLSVNYISYECPQYPEFGHIAFYSDGEELRLVEQDFTAGDHFGKTVRYYIWENKVFFVYSSESSWSFDMGTLENDGETYGTIDEHIEDRFYIHEWEPVRCLQKAYETRSSSTDNPTSETVANMEVDCSEAYDALDFFEQLLQFIDYSGDQDACIWEE